MSKKAKPTTSTMTPWAGATPYLTGANGILPKGLEQFQNGGWTEPMQGGVDAYAQSLKDRFTDPTMQYIQSGAGGVMRGDFDTNFGNVANIQGVNNISAPQTSMVAARQGQGALDPTGALGQMLSGDVSNPYLENQAFAMMGNMARNLNENVMPGIRSEALASGQYGGSRQGIAEGLAMSRMNQDLAPALTNMFGNAYENAQGRMAGAAGQLNDQAYNNAQANAGRMFGADQFNAQNQLNTQQFNANLGLQNNQQQLARNTQNLQNRMQGLGAMQAGQQMQDNTFNSYMGALGMPQAYNQNNLTNYANLVSQTAGMGGTQSQTNYKNPIASALGGGLAGGAVMGPMGAAIGGGLGLLGGLF